MYYFFGASLNCYGALKFFGKENVIAIIDNNSRKTGTLYENVPVISFDDFLDRWNGEVIIITAFAAGEEIVKQLENNNIKKYFVCPYMRSGFFTCEEMIRMWELEQYSSFDILASNPISDTIMNRIKKSKNCQIKNIVDSNEVNSIIGADVIINMDENHNLSVNIKGYQKVINFWQELNNQLKDKYIYLSKYKNIYNSQKCFLIGNGPSLRYQDLDVLASQNIISFGCNRVYLIFEKTEWRPHFYIVIDDDAYRAVKDNIREFSFTMFAKDFFGTEVNDNRINKFRSADARYYPGYPSFSDDMTKVLYGGRTVMYEMLQIAAYMGFKEIYLLGVDFSWGEDGRDTHFCKDYMNDKLVKDAMYLKEEQKHAYIAAKNYADAHGIKIYNATRGGHLDVFERVNFDELF